MLVAREGVGVTTVVAKVVLALFLILIQRITPVAMAPKQRTAAAIAKHMGNSVSGFCKLCMESKDEMGRESVGDLGGEGGGGELGGGGGGECWREHVVVSAGTLPLPPHALYINQKC